MDLEANAVAKRIGKAFDQRICTLVMLPRRKAVLVEVLGDLLVSILASRRDGSVRNLQSLEAVTVESHQVVGWRAGNERARHICVDAGTSVPGKAVDDARLIIEDRSAPQCVTVEASVSRLHEDLLAFGALGQQLGLHCLPDQLGSQHLALE